MVGTYRDLGTTKNPTFDDVTISGDLTVNGTTTTINSTTFEVADDVEITENNKGVRFWNTSNASDGVIRLDASNNLYYETGVGGSHQFYNNNGSDLVCELEGSGAATFTPRSASNVTGVLIDQDGDGVALKIDSEATTKSALRLESTPNNDIFSLTIIHSATNVFGIARNDDTNDDVVLKLGNHYLWVDSTGDLRISSSSPTSDTDGTVVGTQS